MSMVVFTFDTVAKTLTAEMDGVALDNVADVMFYRESPGRYSMGVVQRTRNESNGTVVYTQTCANEQALPNLGTPGTPAQRPTMSDEEMAKTRAAIAALFLPEAEAAATAAEAAE
jgi:hypothetical protein